MGCWEGGANPLNPAIRTPVGPLRIQIQAAGSNPAAGRATVIRVPRLGPAPVPVRRTAILDLRSIRADKATATLGLRLDRDPVHRTAILDLPSTPVARATATQDLRSVRDPARRIEILGRPSALGPVQTAPDLIAIRPLSLLSNITAAASALAAETDCSTLATNNNRAVGR